MAATGERIREAASEERGMLKREDAKEKEKLVQVSIFVKLTLEKKYKNKHYRKIPLKLVTV